MFSKYSRTSVARTLHDCFELVLEFLGKIHSCRFDLIKVDFPFYIEKSILCVLIRIASMRRF